MTKDEIVLELKLLLLSDNYTLFNGRFFDSEVPKSISDIENLDKVGGITIWINNTKCQPKCSSRGAGQMSGKFLFDYYKDPIIEFDLGKTTSKLFSPSRFFYKTGWLDDKNLGELHTKLTNKLVRTFKKKLITTTFIKPFYISESIIKHLDNDYELELGDGGVRVDKQKINGT